MGSVIDGESVVGGGSLPGGTLSTKLTAVKVQGRGGQTFAEKLRSYQPPIIARVEKTQVILDPRTIDPKDDMLVLQSLKTAMSAD